MRITDGKRTVDIEAKVWTGSGYSPCWVADMFNAGQLEYDEDSDTYTVESVKDCILYAEEWRDRTGDFADDEDTTEERFVFVEEA